MANSNTIVDAFRTAGVATDQALVLNNPGGSNPWLFTLPASAVANAGAPCILEVPTTAANGVMNGPQVGIGLAQANNPWYADGNAFIVRAIGRIQPNTFGKTFKLYLFAGNGTDGSAGALGEKQIGFVSVTLPAQSTNVAYTNYDVEAKCLWDSQSLQLTGAFSGFVAGTLITSAAFSVVNPSGWVAQQAAGAYNALPFVIGVNLTSTAAGTPDVVTLEEFTADCN